LQSKRLYKAVKFKKSTSLVYFVGWMSDICLNWTKEVILLYYVLLRVNFQQQLPTYYTQVRTKQDFVNTFKLHEYFNLVNFREPR